MLEIRNVFWVCPKFGESVKRNLHMHCVPLGKKCPFPSLRAAQYSPSLRLHAKSEKTHTRTLYTRLSFRSFQTTLRKEASENLMP